MRIVLINPPYTAWTPRMRHITPLLGAAAPLGLLALAAYARDQSSDMTISIIDAPARGLSVEDCAHSALSAQPDVVGITATTPAASAAAAIAGLSKRWRPRFSSYSAVRPDCG